MDNIISKMKYELGDLKYQLMVSKEENNQIKDKIKNLNKQNQALQDLNIQINEQAIKNKPDNNANSKMVFKLEKELSINLDKLSELREFIKLQDNKILELYEEKQKLNNRFYSNEKLQGHRYAFSNIPNDEEGNKFVEQMKLYFNYDSYDFRKRGQYLDNNKLSIGESWKTYEDGQPLSKSRCIRIYIDKKKEGK